nr:MAG TPA: hypothetical protein [Caudoviricetes sp.]
MADVQIARLNVNSVTRVYTLSFPMCTFILISSSVYVKHLK